MATRKKKKPTKKKAVKKVTKKATKKATKKVAAKKKASKKAVKKTTGKKKAAKKSTPKKIAKKALRKTVAKKATKKVAAKAIKKVTKKPAKKSTPALSQWKQLISPLEDRVLLLKDEAQQITSGGLYIPEMAQVKPNTAQVVAVGPGKVDKKGKIKPLDVKVGDRVLLTQYAGTEFKFEGHELIMLREDEILGVQE